MSAHNHNGVFHDHEGGETWHNHGQPARHSRGWFFFFIPFGVLGMICVLFQLISTWPTAPTPPASPANVSTSVVATPDSYTVSACRSFYAALNANGSPTPTTEFRAALAAQMGAPAGQLYNDAATAEAAGITAGGTDLSAVEADCAAAGVSS